MKKTLLSLSFILLAIAVFSQGKQAEWGLSLKGGTYALPHSAEIQYSYLPGNYVHKPGYAAMAGLYGKFRLGRWLALSGELLYSFAEFKASEEYGFRETDPGSQPLIEISHDQYFVTQSLLMPVNVHIGRGLNPVFSGYIGAAPMWSYETTVSYQSGDQKSLPKAWEPDSEKESRPWQWLLSAGMEYRLTKRYSIGLQMLLNPHPVSKLYEFNYSAGRYPAPMKSFSVTLRHRIDY